MDKAETKLPSLYLAVMAVFGWFALISQLYLIIQNRVVSIAETIVRYFSFFTILTNLIVAVCVTALLLKPNSKWGSWFSKPAILTAITVYIAIVGIVYNTILRFLCQPQGLQFVTDELLHTAIPLLFMSYWFLYVPKIGLQYKQFFSWLTYPLIYVIFTAVHGAITGFYPYPFVDVAQLGYPRVLMNTAGLLVAFSGLSLFLIAIARYMSREKT
jgi:hypothetical protein